MTLASRDHGCPRIMCHRFAYQYVSRYLFIFHVTITNMRESRRFRLDSSFIIMTSSLSRTLCHCDVFRPELCAAMTFYPALVTPNLLPGSSTLLSLTRLDVVLVSYLYGSCARLYLYVSYLYIYWVGDGTIPIFNLLCNHPSVVTCEIPRTLARLL